MTCPPCARRSRTVASGRPRCRRRVALSRLGALLLLGLSGAGEAQPAGGASGGGGGGRGPRAGAPQERSGRRLGRGRRRDLVVRDRVTPHWFDDARRFWYRNDLHDGAKEFIVVDAERGVREPAFDHARLAAALSEATGEDFRASEPPFERIAVVEGGGAVVFRVEGTPWRCDLDSYVLTELPADDAAAVLDDPSEEGRDRSRRRRRPRRRGPQDSVDSPDGQWTAFTKGHDVYLRSQDEDATEIRLSRDGTEELSYGRLTWAPGSDALVAFRIDRVERKEVYLIESSPPDGGRARLKTRGYTLPGDEFPTYELNVFRVPSGEHIEPEVDLFEHEWLSPRLRWKADGRRFTYQQTDRGHQRFRVIEVDAETGAVRNIIDERSDTFIWTAHTENVDLDRVNWLEGSEEIIYASERDGWRHLYLIDAEKAEMVDQITRGEWVVRGIDRIDEKNRQVWFRASGMNPDQDPYFVHYYRVNFDGSGLVALTEGNGDHSIEYSPDRRYLIDRYSRADMAPVTELRRVSDGALVCELETADTSRLEESGWRAPEVFVAKGRDGETDIWGLIHRPRDFDPSEKYPVIESIYAGPQTSVVPKRFRARSRFRSLLERGFIVAQIDGMGTANRSKAFHDVCWKNLKDAGLPDRILWHEAVAEEYSHYDISRVGIYGNSAGGQNAAAAVLFHPEFYKAAVASCGCHDNRMDKASWNEQWMGYPVGPQYAECSNIENAHRLRGELFLIVGELDRNVPPESTMRFVHALIEAGKDFDLLVIPGGGHGMGGAYGRRRMVDFFTRHLLGVEPPDRNGEAPRESG